DRPHRPPRRPECLPLRSQPVRDARPAGHRVSPGLRLESVQAPTQKAGVETGGLKSAGPLPSRASAPRLYSRLSSRSPRRRLQPAVLPWPFQGPDPGAYLSGTIRTHVGVGVEATWPVGVSVPETGSIRNETSESEPWFAA